jgi:TatD DNase family protein
LDKKKNQSKESQRLFIEPEDNLPIIDCHCHLPWDRPPKDPFFEYNSQLDRFFTKGGKYLITCSVDLKSARNMLEFTKKHPKIGMTAGFAPQTVTYTTPEKLEKEFIQWLSWIRSNHENILGIGEIGLDFHHAKTESQRNQQISYFTRIIAELNSFNKPFILHVRNPTAADCDPMNKNHEYNLPDSVNQQILALLKDQGVSPQRVIWHCFSGPEGWGERLAHQGFILSVPSSAYGFPRWRKQIEHVPLGQMITETDSQYQHPFKMGSINEPANVAYAIVAIANVLSQAQSEVAKQIVKNVQKIYGVPLTTD